MMEDRIKEQLSLDWQGIPLSVSYEANWMNGIGNVSHIEVHSPDKQPLPITSTGYRSIFVSPEILSEWGGPLPYVSAMLAAEAKRPEWIAAQAKRQQLTLF